MKDFLSATSKNHIDESDIPTKTSVPLISDVWQAEKEYRQPNETQTVHIPKNNLRLEDTVHWYDDNYVEVDSN
jgi:hypothetical protein